MRNGRYNEIRNRAIRCIHLRVPCTQNVLQSPGVSAQYYGKILPLGPNGQPAIYTHRIGTGFNTLVFCNLHCIYIQTAVTYITLVWGSLRLVPIKTIQSPPFSDAFYNYVLQASAAFGCARSMSRRPVDNAGHPSPFG